MKTIRYALIFLSVIQINNVLAQDAIEEITVSSFYFFTKKVENSGIGEKLSSDSRSQN